MEGNVSRGGGTGGGGLNDTVQQQPPPFLSKTYDMVNDSATDAVVSWGPQNNSFVVWNTPEFSEKLLPKYFKHNNFSSFVRQLNTYGFRKVDPDRWEFANEGFLRGQKHLLKGISRRKPSSVQNQTSQPQGQNSAVGPCVEVGKFGLEEEIERLKRDKNILMQELVRLRQQQQTTDDQLQTLVKRLKGMEKRQQQMMSFLAKAVRSPGLFAQFVQQNDSSKRIEGVNKKRRLPKQEDNLNMGTSGSPDGQIIKYQPLMNEAAKAVLMQILNMDASPRLERANGSAGFLLGDSPSPSGALESGISSDHISGITVSEMPSSTGISSGICAANSEISDVSSASAACASDVKSITSVSDLVVTARLPHIPDISTFTAVPQAIPLSQNNLVVPDLPSMQEMMPEDDVGNAPDSNFTLPAVEDVLIDPLSVDMDGISPLRLDSFSHDADIDLFMDDMKLPGINDSFWEQFLAASPVSVGEAEDADSTPLEDGNKVIQVEGESNHDQCQNMEDLTEQMGLLSSEPNL